MEQIGRITLVRLLIVYFIAHGRQQYSTWDYVQATSILCRSRSFSHTLGLSHDQYVSQKCAVSCNQSNRLPMDAIPLSMRGIIIIAHAIISLFHFFYFNRFLCDSMRFYSNRLIHVYFFFGMYLVRFTALLQLVKMIGEKTTPTSLNLCTESAAHNGNNVAYNILLYMYI